MSFLKRFSLVFLGFILLLFFFSFFLPSALKIERKIAIDASADMVFHQVDELKNWKNWSVWAEKDASIYTKKDNFSVPSSGVGATFSWASEDDGVGEGTMKITKSQPFDLVELSLDFGTGDVLSYWNFQQKEDVVEVTWGINFDFGFNPISKWFGLFLEDELAEDLEKGLQKLKSFTENLPKINSGIVTQQKIEKPLWFLSIRELVDGRAIATIHSKLFSEIGMYMEKNKISDDLPPLVIYHSWTDTLVDIEAGLLLEDSIGVNSSRIKLNKIKPGNVVMATHYGAYDRIPETYFSINEWMRKNEVQVIGAPWELYIVDPSIEQNPDKWVTEIYFPIN
ncbi:MAG: SRPBCC family protein [Flavobacteriales bacterium]|nr:SRPBCC family protein [Flavobacteriales bacterium]MCB9173219.1 SRPBCC family protein [Flavobacteriales bacterium]